MPLPISLRPLLRAYLRSLATRAIHRLWFGSPGIYADVPGTFDAELERLKRDVCRAIGIDAPKTPTTVSPQTAPVRGDSEPVGESRTSPEPARGIDLAGNSSRPRCAGCGSRGGIEHFYDCPIWCRPQRGEA